MMKARKWGKTVTIPRMLRDIYRYSKGERRNFEGALLAEYVISEGLEYGTFYLKFFETHEHNHLFHRDTGNETRKLLEKVYFKTDSRF